MLTRSQDDPPSPPKRPIVHAARKDADPHFAINDESSPAVDRPKSSHAQQVRDIYDDPTEEDNQMKKSARNTGFKSDNSRRGDDFGAHYSMADTQDQNAAPNKGSSRADMQEQWNFGTPAEEKKIYRTAGDGMGSRKGADTAEVTKKPLYKTAGDGMGGRRGGNRLWGFGDDSDPEVEADVRKTARSRQQQAGAAN